MMEKTMANLYTRITLLIPAMMVVMASKAFADEERPGFSELFKPEENSAALIFLRRVVGCAFDKIWTGPGGAMACSDSDDIFATAIKVFNFAFLAIIALVATYMIFASLKDTANDGEIGGKSQSTSWTLMLAAVAALLVFPAFNGWSALQMGTLYVAKLSTGLGDYSWRTMGPMFANAASVDAVFKSQTDLNDGLFYDTDTSLKEQIALGLVARLSGELCKDALVAGAKSMSMSDAAITRTTKVDSNWQQDKGFIELFFQASSAFNNSTGLCGGNKIIYTKASSETLPGNNGGANIIPSSDAQQKKLADLLNKLAADGARKGAEALAQQLDAQGTILYAKLFPADGVRQRGQAEIVAIDRAVNEVISKTKQAIRNGLSSAPNDVKQIVQDTMTDQHKNGWLYAVLYQRMIVSGANSLHTLQNVELFLSSSMAQRDIQAAWGCVVDTGAFSFSSECNTQIRTFFNQYNTDMAALDQLKPMFLNAANGTSSLGSNAVDLGNSLDNERQSAINNGIQWLVASISHMGETGSNAWSDPIPQMQATGGNMMLVGGTLVAAGETASFIGEAVGSKVGTLVGGGIGGTVTPIGWLFVASGFVLSAIVPWMPLIYFLLAALSWFLLVVQALVSSPVWLMQMFTRNTSGGIAGTGFSKALLVLFAILIRPVLIIIGFIVAMFLLRIGHDILSVFFRNIFAATAYSASTFSMSGLALSAGSFFVYAATCVTLVAVCCSFIDGLGDMVIDQVEAGASRLYQGEMRGQGQTALGNPASAIAIAGAMRGGSSGLGSRIGAAPKGRATKATNAPLSLTFRG
jgi:conjugal transfer/type IV secretion protein DotA/TraY